MANSIALFKKYIDKLDDVYKYSALSIDLDSDPATAQQGANANEIVIPKISMQGLANYSRNSGYVSGDVTLTNETVQFNYDRGRKFTVDAMDNEETVGVAFGRLAAEFLRTRVVPEMDAFTFAKLAGTTGISTTAAAALTTGANVITALRAATNEMDEDEVPVEDRILYITPTLYGLVQDLDTTKSKEVLARFNKRVLVPQTRFYTEITLQDGTTEGQEAGGYVKTATTGKDINFLAVSKSAIHKYRKHIVNKIISPEENQFSDGWAFFYRAYGLVDVYENKVAGVYLHKSTT